MDAGQLLETMLPMAVALNIAEFQRRPWSELQAIATEASQFIGEHGDALMYKQKGTTAKAFNMLAKGVAVMSFAQGGVTLFGHHYEATHPESLTTGAGRWLYHSTFAVNLPDIAREGIVPVEEGPESKRPKVYFTGIINQAARHIKAALDLPNFSYAGDPVLLRVHSAHVGDIQHVGGLSDDWYVERSIPAVFIQVWVPQTGFWTEVKEAVKQGYFDLQAYGETKEALLQYIKESWPEV